MKYKTDNEWDEMNKEVIALVNAISENFNALVL